MTASVADRVPADARARAGAWTIPWPLYAVVLASTCIVVGLIWDVSWHRTVGRDRKPAALEPYIGMAGHAVVTRDDGAVFVHLHPSGSISMASQMTFQMRQPGDTVPGRLRERIRLIETSHARAPIDHGGVISFPYAFPKPGMYHMWVQVKRAGRILTGAFAFDVESVA